MLVVEDGGNKSLWGSGEEDWMDGWVSNYVGPLFQSLLTQCPHNRPQLHSILQRITQLEFNRFINNNTLQLSLRDKFPTQLFAHFALKYPFSSSKEIKTKEQEEAGRYGLLLGEER
jgi:hypothetical protein